MFGISIEMLAGIVVGFVLVGSGLFYLMRKGF